jgi:hypothetical protein
MMIWGAESCCPTWRVNIHYGDVGLRVLDHGQTGQAIARFTHHLVVCLFGNDLAQTAAKNGMIINYDNAYHFLRGDEYSASISVGTKSGLAFAAG